MRTQQRFLRLYAGVLTCLFVCVLLLGARKREGRAKFTEIDVERINIVEKDGRKRLVLSNSALFPAVVSSAGITKERTVRGQGGLLFYDSDGGEAGGLSVRSRSM